MTAVSFRWGGGKLYFPLLLFGDERNFFIIVIIRNSWIQSMILAPGGSYREGRKKKNY